ncbi:hypothetical protein [Sphingorhabdus sp.]|uniref:hypothetical protein n=1 Tax=Sphingorhabdus sp. TaxID=1902408 RepID=UPI0035B270F9
MFQKTQKQKLVSPKLSELLGQLDIVGPTVNDDIRRIINRYGVDAVKLAVKEQTKSKKGRKPEKDWPELRDVIEADARDWLIGNDPFKNRSNYAIAKDFALKRPGQSAISTHQRIERKLKKKPHDRYWYTLVTAQRISWDSFPFAQHLRALKALAELPASNGGHHSWQLAVENAERDISDYEKKTGEYPAAHLSMKAVEDVARNALLVPPLRQGLGLAGLLAGYIPESKKAT